MARRASATWQRAVRVGARMLPATLLLASLLPMAPAAHAEQADDDATAVVDVRRSDLTAEHWIARLSDPDALLLDRAGIAAQNARMRAGDPSIVDLAALPDPLPQRWVRRLIEALSSPPTRPLYAADGQRLSPAALSALHDSLALGTVAARGPLRYGLVVHRADLRTFPTAQPAFAAPGDTDIDRFQESALFPGDAVAVLHASADGRWLFVASERYTAWIEARHVALGERAAVLGYATRTPYLVVAGATVRTTYTPDEPRVSALQLDMGVRLPVLADWPADRAVNGQHPYTAHVVDLPVREADGRLRFAPALVPRVADVSSGYLPLTRAHLVRQAFKFLGERYGWGHAHDARDCSGFVSEIYRSFGVLLPRNTGDQARSPALDRLAFNADTPHARRMAAVRALQPGDLVYIPGHVLVNLGQQRGQAFMIHDIHGGSWRGADGQRVDARLNGVSVTPLEPLLFDDGASYVDHITAIQRIRPAATPAAAP